MNTVLRPLVSSVPLASFSTSSMKPNEVLIDSPKPYTGPKFFSWPWLKAYLKHTWSATKLSGADMRQLYRYKINPPRNLDETMLRTTLRADLIKLIPFSLIVIIPFAEVCLPFYLALYQNAIPSRYLTESFQEKRNYRRSLSVQKSKNAFKEMMLKMIDTMFAKENGQIEASIKIKDFLQSPENAKSPEKLSEIRPIFEKYVWPKILDNPKMAREFMNCIGLFPLTGLYYMNAVFRKLGLSEVTLGSPVMSTIFKFYPKMRINKRVRTLEFYDQYLNEQSINDLTKENLIEAAFSRGITGLGKTTENVMQELKDWKKMRSNGLPVSLLLFANICK